MTKKVQKNSLKELKNNQTTYRRGIIRNDRKSENRRTYYKEMDASLVGVPVFKTVCMALILSQVGSIPTHLRHISKNL